MNFLLKISENPLLPLVVIAAVWYTTRDILMLTAAFMVVVTLQVLIEKLVKGNVGKVLFTSWCILMPLGTVTLLLRDPIFLQWKFSIFYWLLGFFLIGSQLIKGPFLIKKMLIAVAPQFNDVPNHAWRNVTYFISFGLLITGTINLYIIYFSDIETWVNFKIYGVIILNFIIIIPTFLYLFKQITPASKT